MESANSFAVSLNFAFSFPPNAHQMPQDDSLIHIRWNPPRLELRVFAAVLLFVFAMVAWAVQRRFDLPWVVTGLYVIGVGLFVVGMLFPTSLRYLYVGWMCLFFPVGWLVSHTVLGTLFFGVIWPVGWLRKRLVGDPLKREINAEQKTYWEPVIEKSNPKDFFRQF
jgi:Saxitoxin biosynthesis operon protein SxtJ